MRDVLPRTYVVSDWISYGTEEAALTVLKVMGPWEMSRKAVFIQGDVAGTALSLPQSGGNGSAQIVSRTADRMMISGASEKEGFLILSDAYHRNWGASVNGRETVVLPVNNVFRAVRVPSGAFTVEFRYEDKGFNGVAALSFLGLAGFFLPGLAVVLTGNRFRYILRLERSKHKI